MIGFDMGGNVIGGPGTFGDPDDESARGAYVSGYGTTGLQTAKNVPIGIGQQVLGQSPNELAVTYGLLDPDEQFEALTYEPYEISLGPVSFSTENLVGPALDTYNTVVAPAVQGFLDAPLAETAATAVLGVPSTLGGLVVGALEGLQEEGQTVQDLVSSFVNPSTSSGVSMGGLNAVVGHPDFGLDAPTVDPTFGIEESPSINVPEVFNAIPSVIEGWNTIENFIAPPTSSLDDAVFDLDTAIASTSPNAFESAFGIGYSGVSPDMGAVSQEGGEALQEALAQRAAETIIVQEAARQVTPESSKVTIPVSSGPDIVIDPAPSSVRVAAKSIAKPKQFKKLPKVAQKQIRKGKVPTGGSDYVQDMVRNFIAPPTPPTPRGQRPAGANR